MTAFKSSKSKGGAVFCRSQAARKEATHHSSYGTICPRLWNPKIMSGLRFMAATRSRLGIILFASWSAVSKDSTSRRLGYCSTSLHRQHKDRLPCYPVSQIRNIGQRQRAVAGKL